MLFSKGKPKNCHGCEHRRECGGEKKNCIYRLKALEARMDASFPCNGCPYGKHHEVCFPCYKNMMGQPGIAKWEKENPDVILE